METREIGWQQAVSNIDLEEWNAGKTIDTVRRVTTGLNAALRDLDDRYAAERHAILETYTAQMRQIMQAETPADATQEIQRVAVEDSYI